MSEKKNVPKLRFPEFTEPWEQRKLGDVFKEYTEKNHIELPTLTIIQGGGTVKREDSNRSLMYDQTNLANYKMVRKDDFIVHLRSFEGGLEKSSLDGIISPAYHTFHSDSADSRFYYPYFRSHEFIKHKLVPHVYGIRDGRSIDIDGMKTIDIPYTSLDEQHAIGDYLEQFDTLITLHQRKFDHVKDLKKSMLQKMFPKNGQLYPEVRFPEFTDAWEQRKLCEFTDSYSGGTPVAGKKEYYDGDIPFIRSGEISSDETELFITNKGLNNSSAKMVKKGDILYALYGATSGEVSISKLKGAINQAILAIQPHLNYDSQFLMQWLRKSKENIINTYLQGGQGNLSGNIVKELLVDLPTYEEQQKIGAYFSNLDSLITLHQRELDHLKLLKKGMLQQMFV